MGGKLSSAMSNIFLNIMEKNTIKKFIDQKTLIFYGRYVDDCLLVVRKRSKNLILTEMNNFDPFLKFTSEEMHNNCIKFLDTNVIISNNKLELKQFFKHDNVVINYKKAVSPLQYKNSCLIGEIYGANNSTSNNNNRELALLNLKNTFLNNAYPEKLINSKINEIKNRNFLANPNKALREADRNNPDLNFFTLSLPFTSHRCSKIASNLKKILSKYTPNYRLNVCFKTITLENIILPRLKAQKSWMLIPNSVYLFTCECQIETYVGQTRKILKSRIFQHGSAKRHSNIYNHTSQCEIFLNARQNKYGIAPNDTQCRSFLLEHFKCLKSNLANWHERMGYESLCITQLQPTLNKQKKFQKPNLICTCVTKIEDYTSLVPCAFH